MNPRALFSVSLVASFAILGSITTVLAHGGDMDLGTAEDAPSTPEHHPTYFSRPENGGVIYAHISLMILAWVFLMPIAVMFSLARSKYTLLAQATFLAVNMVGVMLSAIYNENTPDLYPNNAHHKLGWIATFVVTAQVVVGLVARAAGSRKADLDWNTRETEYAFSIPVTRETMAEHESPFRKSRRLSNDSGHGTGRNTESLQSHSRSHSSAAVLPTSPIISLPGSLKEGAGHGHDEEEEDGPEAYEAFIGRSQAPSLARTVLSLNGRARKLLSVVYNFVDRTVIVFGFITLCTGVVTFGRFFEGRQIFTGLAHWIKGGVFFLLGVLTLGRWAGSFGDLGWAWNVRPKVSGQKWRPTAEFMESALILSYGATNIFLEHLGNAGKEFSSQDLEHISITVLFIGGGVCGILVESTRIRQLLNVTVGEAARGISDHSFADEEQSPMKEPEAYPFSTNPIPSLVILLLGIMISSHTQEDKTSMMVHKQWATMLSGASFSRALTYVLMWMKPPRSIYPSRPPTELLTSFGLLSGGIIFMASSGDTVDAMKHYHLDSMFLLTVTMGLVAMLMAWIIFVIALKGWAVRNEARWSTSSLRQPRTNARDSRAISPSQPT